MWFKCPIERIEKRALLNITDLNMKSHQPICLSSRSVFLNLFWLAAPLLLIEQISVTPFYILLVNRPQVRKLAAPKLRTTLTHDSKDTNLFHKYLNQVVTFLSLKWLLFVDSLYQIIFNFININGSSYSDNIFTGYCKNDVTASGGKGSNIMRHQY